MGEGRTASIGPSAAPSLPLSITSQHEILSGDEDDGDDDDNDDDDKDDDDDDGDERRR